jgi:predicted CoA-binding protein
MSALASPDHRSYDPAFLRGLLERARTIAVVGASPDPWRPSFGVTGYMKRAGYRIIPINPTTTGQMVHGEPCRASLRDVLDTVDLVNVFRRTDAVPEVVEEAIAAGAPALWLQLGVRHLEAARRAEAAGLTVVMDRCISVEHSRLMR